MEMNDYIKKHFKYDHKTGIITRDDRKNSNGSIDKDGYLILKIKRKQYKSHRIAWFLHYGRFPSRVIDHINSNKLDNRIINLRNVTSSTNAIAAKRKPNKDTGQVGIYLDRSTRGLLAKYTTRINNRTYRFRELKDAIKFREKNYVKRTKCDPKKTKGKQKSI